MKLLFFAEPVTLAHLARPLALAAACGTDEVVIACGEHYRPYAAASGLDTVDLPGLSPAVFAQRLRAGRAVYTDDLLRQYLDADRALIRQHRPDVVIGDFRVSLPVAARLEGVPSVSIANACWSPYRRGPYPVPELPWTRVQPLALAQRVFDLARPLAFALQARPMQRLRRSHGLPALPGGLPAAYVEADRVLYADHGPLFPLHGMPAHHEFIGPVLWSPAVTAPPWWDDLPSDRPLVYVSAGSSGSADLVHTAVRALEGAGVAVVGSGVGAAAVAAHAWLAPFVPGDLATRRAAVVVNNGGSLTSYQAAVCGKPLVGVPSNLDQCLNIAAFRQARMARVLRADRLSPRRLREAVMAQLASSDAASAASRLAVDLQAAPPAGERFRRAIERLSASPAQACIADDVLTRP